MGTKKIEVTISECLSTTTYIEVDENADITNPVVLQDAVIEQVVLPSDCLEHCEYYGWDIDDFCVTY
jgi:hypothetical protein